MEGIKDCSPGDPGAGSNKAASLFAGHTGVAKTLEIIRE